MYGSGALATFSQVFDGQKNALLKIVFAEAVLTVARQNIRHNVIVIDGGHAVYGVHVIVHQSDAYLTECGYPFEIACIQINISICHHPFHFPF